MKFRNTCFYLLTAAVFSSTFSTVSSGQTAHPTPAPAAPPVAAKAAPPLTEDALRAQWQGKLIFLRGSYMGDDLQFDENGKIKGSPTVASFTLSALEVKKIHLSKHKLDIEADRYGLHFFGALPYEDETKSYDKVKISKKPIHITIERELVVIPKVKKTKKAPPSKNAQELAAAQTLKTRAATQPATIASATPATQVVPANPVSDTSDTRIAVSPAHSAMLMHGALDVVFAGDIDQRMIAGLPDYWRQYFDSKSRHRLFMPADPSIQTVTEGMTAPAVLNSIDPSSNEYAQKYGIAGMALLRTVVDADGKPQQIAIARPIGFGLDEKAVDAIKNSRFKPALQNGRPVPVVIDLVVTFRIYSNRTKPGSVTKGSKATVLAASVADIDAPGPRAKVLQ